VVLADVIVHQRCGVHHFDHRAQPHHAVTLVTQRPGCQQEQGRPNPLAPAFAQVVGNLGNGSDIGDSIAHQLSFDRGQVPA
jgi:hypothetical protein